MATRTHTDTGTALQVQDPNGTYRTASDEEVLHAARSTINRRFRRGKALTSPADSQEFLRIRLAHLEHEVFAVLWLDNRHRLIAFEELFRGTIDGSSVHSREVVKSALGHNAAACIVAHYVPGNIMGVMCPKSLCGASCNSFGERITSV